MQFLYSIFKYVLEMKTVQSYPILAPMENVCVVKALNAPDKLRIPVIKEHVNVVLTWNA